MGPPVVLRHAVKLDVRSLADFQWSKYEAALAGLAGVPRANVFVTPEPGSGTLEAVATIVRRLDAAEGRALPVVLREHYPGTSTRTVSPVEMADQIVRSSRWRGL